MEDYLDNPAPKTLILRHDVDKLPQNSLRTAEMQNRLGVKGTYYFRVTPGSYHPKVIAAIAKLGHEIGYHYEDLTICKGNVAKAHEHFKVWLEKFKTFYPVRTICMHGSPMTKWDNKDLWKEYNYKDLGIIGEPYFDLDFNKMLYITDTGRRFDGAKVSVRDKVKTQLCHDFKSTEDIIKGLDQDKLSNEVMLTLHPQRWTNASFGWFKELVMQNIKNVVKRFIILLR